MNDSLEQNFLSLPYYALNSEVKDLEIRIKDRITVTLQYACKSWYSHIEASGDITGIVSTLRGFFFFFFGVVRKLSHVLEAQGLYMTPGGNALTH